MKKPTLLVVDDEILNIELISNKLKSFCKIKVAQNGKRALIILEKIKIDLILLDINMPYMNGFEVTQKIKDNDKTKDIPIIFLSAATDHQSIIKGFQLGAVDYITKPFNEEELRVRINNHLNTHILQEKLNTHIKELEEAKELALKQQETIINQARLSALSEMIENIAHQWRQPLSIISTTATSIKVLQELSTITEEQISDKCTVIEKNTQYLSNIIDDFQLLTKSNSVSMEFKLRDNLDSLIRLLDTKIEQYNVVISFDIDENLYVKGVQNKLIQCFVNIFNNSVDAITHNKEGYKEIIKISAYSIDKDVFIEFHDNSGGINPDDIKKIFDPYFTTKHKSQGTGLGLYTTYQIIKNVFKGSISIKNEELTYKNQTYMGTKSIIKLPIETI